MSFLSVQLHHGRTCTALGKAIKPSSRAPFYDGGTFADVAHSIVSERRPDMHGEMRKHLSHALSERSLKDQEDLVSEVMDEFFKRLGMNTSGETGADNVFWFNLTTFDITGSLFFRTSSGGLTSGADENGLEMAQ